MGRKNAKEKNQNSGEGDLTGEFQGRIQENLKKRRTEDKTALNFITSDRLTTAYTTIKNMFSRKVVSQPAQQNKRPSSKTYLVDSAVKYDERDALVKSRNKSLSKGSEKKVAKKRMCDESDDSNASSSSHLQRFLSDLKSHVQSPVSNSIAPTPSGLREKVVAAKRTGEFENHPKKSCDKSDPEEETVSADSKRFYQEVFAKEMVDSLADLLPKFWKRDAVIDLKKKIRTAYYANENERNAYFEQKLLENQLSQDFSTPSEYREYREEFSTPKEYGGCQEDNQQECSADPFEFFMNFNHERPDESMPLAHMPERRRSQAREVGISTKNDYLTQNFTINATDLINSEYSNKPWYVAPVDSERFGGDFAPSGMDKQHLQSGLLLTAPTGTDSNPLDESVRVPLPFAIREPEFKFYRRMLY